MPKSRKNREKKKFPEVNTEGAIEFFSEIGSIVLEKKEVRRQR